MHYYQFNIGDYQSHTAHLTEIEDLAYRRMLDWCYLHEKQFPLDLDEISRLVRMRTHSESIAIVLREFFERREDGWIHLRVLQEILKVGIKSEKASESAKARWGKPKDANALPSHSDRYATQDPVPMTHDPLHKTQKKMIKDHSVDKSKDPALQKLDRDSKLATPVPAAIRAKLAALRGSA